MYAALAAVARTPNLGFAWLAFNSACHLTSLRAAELLLEQLSGLVGPAVVTTGDPCRDALDPILVDSRGRAPALKAAFPMNCLGLDRWKS